MKQLFTFIVLLLFLSGCQNQNNNSSAENSHYLIRAKERENPQDYLTLEGLEYDSRALKRDRVHGIIQNLASKTTYKDISIQLKWVDAEGKTIKTKESTMDFVLNPSEVREFAIFQNAPPETATFVVKVERAVAVQ